MMGQYLKWSIVLFVLRIIVEPVLQAITLNKKFIICKIESTDPNAHGYEWIETSWRGRGFSTLQVVTLIAGVISVYQTLFSAIANEGFFGPYISFKTIAQNFVCRKVLGKKNY